MPTIFVEGLLDDALVQVVADATGAEVAAIAGGAGPTFGTGCSTSRDRFWCPTTRVTSQATAAGPDYLGVYIKVNHRTSTKMFGSTMVVQDTAVGNWILSLHLVLMQRCLEFGSVSSVSLTSVNLSLTWLSDVVTHEEPGELVTQVLDRVALVLHTVSVGLSRGR